MELGKEIFTAYCKKKLKNLNSENVKSGSAICLEYIFGISSTLNLCQTLV